MVVRLQPGHERKVSGAEDKVEKEVEDETEEEIIERKHSGTMGLAGGKDENEEEDADVVGDEKEFEIEIARSEEEAVEEVGIENTSEEETVGDSQSIVGIEEEDPLKSDEGSDEDLENNFLCC